MPGIFIFLLSLFLGTLLSYSSFAQTKANLWQHHLGYENVLMRDAHNSPLAYRSNNLSASSRLMRAADASLHQVTLRITIGNNQSVRHGRRAATLTDPVDIFGNQERWTVEANPFLSFMNIELSYAYLHQLNVGNQSMFLGGELRESFYQTGLGLDNWFFNSFSLGPKFRKTFKLERFSFPVELSLPLLSAITVAPYANDPSQPMDNYFWPYVEETRIALLPRFRSLNLSMGLMMKMKKQENTALGIYYQFEGWTYDLYKPTQMISNTISIIYQH